MLKILEVGFRFFNDSFSLLIVNNTLLSFRHCILLIEVRYIESVSFYLWFKRSIDLDKILKLVGTYFLVQQIVDIESVEEGMFEDLTDIVLGP